MQRFTLTPDHIKLLRAANVGWESDEWGAPCIDPKRPFGNGDLYGDMLHILHGIKPDHSRPATYGDTLATTFYRIYEGLGTALQIVLVTGAFEPGVYEADDYKRNWRRIEGY